MPSPSLLDVTLRNVERRYRLPAMDMASFASRQASPATRLAMAIEQARQARNRNETPGKALKREFIDALASLIREAIREEGGDPAFQAMVLRHRATQVREYASLSAHADQYRRQIRTAVNAFAHPGKLRRLPPGPRRDALARLHADASAARWTGLVETARRLLDLPEIMDDTPLAQSLMQLLQSDALRNLRRADELSSDELVLRYQSLCDRHGPRSGSHAAATLGAASKRRGAAVEALAARALTRLAQRLDEEDASPDSYRVVTSLHIPASIPGKADRAKSEWDAVLLRKAKSLDPTPVWNACLLVEAKASVDAATTDLPRLMRGLRLLGHAKEDAVYPFHTQQGVVNLHGASLQALARNQADLKHIVLYCCDAPADATPPRLLSAASRMQLLSVPATLEFARMSTEDRLADSQILEAVWIGLLESPRWHAVLNQYCMLRQARELMVHIDDLSAAIDSAPNGGAGI